MGVGSPLLPHPPPHSTSSLNECLAGANDHWFGGTPGPILSTCLQQFCPHLSVGLDHCFPGESSRPLARPQASCTAHADPLPGPSVPGSAHSSFRSVTSFLKAFLTRSAQEELTARVDFHQHHRALPRLCLLPGLLPLSDREPQEGRDPIFLAPFTSSTALGTPHKCVVP